MQAAVGHPLTVHGTGGQTRAFIHIRDTVNCLKLAVDNPPEKGERVKIFNQTTECHNIKDLAEKIAALTGAQIRYYRNPRNEDMKNDLRFCKDSFLNLGLKPITLNNGLMLEVSNIASMYKDRCNKAKIICTSTWRPGMPVDFEGSFEPIVNNSEI
jgi:UDP-sulfoquinovose synthase